MGSLIAARRSRPGPSQSRFLTNCFIREQSAIFSRYSHSIVLGGFELMSYTTRFILLPHLQILVESVPARPWEAAPTAVIASSDSTTRTAM